RVGECELVPAASGEDVGLAAQAREGRTGGLQPEPPEARDDALVAAPLERGDGSRVLAGQLRVLVPELIALRAVGRVRPGLPASHCAPSAFRSRQPAPIAGWCPRK